ncbi:VPS4-associated protein 1 [Mycena sp. CBHHK59/15]|nr:VPS4-associated protein 1 [Mycena sp. CBHHK59/15]
MSFTNLYYKRTAGTPKACYICHKPTTTVLATVPLVDFLYTCPTHLTDPGFASSFVDPNASAAASKPALSQEDIGKVVAEWEDRQKKKEKEKKEKEDKEKGNKDTKDTDEDKGKDKAKDTKDAMASPKMPGSLTPKSPPPTHERYTLHRDMFSMRQGEHRKRRQTAQAKDLAPRLPGAPRGTL